MKSVGEAMAIGRTFAESLQKALRSLETGLTGLDDVDDRGPRARATTRTSIRAALGTPDAGPAAQGRAGAAARRRRRADPRVVQDRSVVPRADLQEIVDTEARVKAHGPADSRRDSCAASRRWASPMRGSPSSPARPKPRCARQRHDARRAAGVQAHRHLRGRVRLADRLHVFDLRDRPVRRSAVPTRPQPSDTREGHDPRRRSEPHRPGHRVRLLLLPRLLRAAPSRLRDHHGQLQPGDRLDRLRHLRPALFRAADRRGRARDHPHRAARTARCRASSCSSAARRR